MRKMSPYRRSIAPAVILLFLMISVVFAPVTYAQSGAGAPVIPGTPVPPTPGQPPHRVFTPAPAVPTPGLSGTIQFAVPNAHAESGTGTISGTVYAPDGVTPVPNAFVTWFDYNGAGYTWLCAAADGTYTLTGVPLNTAVKVEAWGYYDCHNNPLPYSHEYWNQQDFRDQANGVTVTSGAPNATGINFTMKLAGHIAGTVYNPDGTTPLMGATVTVWEYSGGTYIADTDTAADGTYSLSVPSGMYRLQMYKSGYAYQYYNDHATYSDADSVAATSGATTSGINFTAHNGGISGTVYLPDGTTPLASAAIYVYDFANNDAAGLGTTDSSGNYQVELLPGTYLVNLYPYPYPAEYYNNHPKLGDADPVVVGSEITPGINFVVDAWGTLNGTVYQPGGSTPVAGAVVTAYASDGSYATSASTNASGFYQLLVRGAATCSARIPAAIRLSSIRMRWTSQALHRSR